MSAEENQIQLIDDYLNDKLSAADKYWFEEKLAWDSSLVSEVAFFRNIQAGIRKDGRKSMKTHLIELEKIHFEQAKLKVPPWHMGFSRLQAIWLSGAAACLIIGLIAYTWLTQQPEKLFIKYYTPYPNVIASIERGVNNPDEKIQALQAYENGNYALAIQKMEKVLQSQPQDVALAFYLGAAYLENRQLDKAIKQLEKVALQPPHDFSTQALWYLSLAYVKNNDSRQAIPLLQTLIREENIYSKRSAQLLEEL